MRLTALALTLAVVACQSAPPEPEPTPVPQGVYRENFDQLADGITLGSAEFILGTDQILMDRYNLPGLPLIELYSWRGDDGNAVFLTFEDGRLTDKSWCCD